MITLSAMELFIVCGVWVGAVILYKAMGRWGSKQCVICGNRISNNRITGRYVEFKTGVRAHLTRWLEEAKETYVGTSRFPTKTPKVPQFKRALQRLRRRQEAEKQ